MGQVPLEMAIGIMGVTDALPIFDRLCTCQGIPVQGHCIHRQNPQTMRRAAPSSTSSDFAAELPAIYVIQPFLGRNINLGPQPVDCCKMRCATMRIVLAH